ncbi:MAG: hypothetical protein KC800_15940 [Candidatus Eremiobacteraeota bacterium]|nr:hypothetical protein [Candidatus Eremiobacteraeota bacterium]
MISKDEFAKLVKDHPPLGKCPEKLQEFPTIQVFNRRQIQKLELRGAALYLRAEADPNEPEEDYEENTLQFGSEADSQALYDQLQAGVAGSEGIE